MSETTRKRARGLNSQERIIFTSMFVHGPSATGRRGVPYVLVGKPGTAKTTRVAALSRLAGLGFQSIISSLRDPTDFLGMPFATKLALTPETQHLSPDGESEILVATYAPARFAIKAAMQRRAVILFDEANTAPPAVQAAQLRLLFEGVCGELELPPGVRFFLAMNATEDAAGGWDIAPPLANRVGWLQWPAPDPNAFATYLMGAGGSHEQPVNAAAEEADVDAAWPGAWAYASGTLAGYLKSNPGAILRMPPSGSKAASEAWASPRTWDFAASMLAGSRIYDLTEVETIDAVGAFVGSGNAAELHTWITNNDLPDPEDFLDGKVAFEHNPSRLDRTAAVLASVTSLVVRPDTDLLRRKSRTERLWSFQLGLAETAPDLLLSSVAALCNEKLMIGSTTAFKVLAKMEPVLTAAGIVK